MVNHDEDIKAVISHFGPLTSADNVYGYRQSTGCLVKQDRKNGTYSQAHQMCFGGLAALIMDCSQYIINTFQFAHPRFSSILEEDKIFFLDYLMNESPFKDCFIENDAKWSVENKISYHKIELPGNLVIGGLTAVREMWEDYSLNGLPHFRNMVKAGVPKDFAWVLCNYIKPFDTDKVKLSSRQTDGGHATWPSNTAETDSVINYLNHNHVGAHKQNFGYNYPYAGVHTLFGSNYDRNALFTQWLLDNNEYTTVEKVNQQPWEAKTIGRRSAVMTHDQWLEESLKFYKKFKEEFME
jgi:hypothetical protein